MLDPEGRGTTGGGRTGRPDSKEKKKLTRKTHPCGRESYGTRRNCLVKNSAWELKKWAFARTTLRRGGGSVWALAKGAAHPFSRGANR